MFARFNTATKYASNNFVARSFHPIRLFCASNARALHVATAEFTNIGSDGTIVTKEISIRVGNPGEAYVLIPTEVGCALQASSYLTNSSSVLSKRADRFALRFFHETRHFAIDTSPGCPRLVIRQQLPHQSIANTSPATLYLYGVMHTIALDGTSDAEFAELASTIRPEIGEALDKLKDM